MKSKALNTFHIIKLKRHNLQKKKTVIVIMAFSWLFHLALGHKVKSQVQEKFDIIKQAFEQL